MTELKEQLIKYISVISDDKLLTIKPLIEMMSNEFSYSIEKIYFEDLTDEEREDILQSREDYKKGETIKFDDVDWD